MCLQIPPKSHTSTTRAGSAARSTERQGISAQVVVLVVDQICHLPPGKCFSACVSGSPQACRASAVSLNMIVHAQCTLVRSGMCIPASFLGPVRSILLVR
ncbi:unnamed protein product [Amoebophrya sp. A120]|nr:unnamed protein product [Amoebophrya sp. A120]|eukprot:GSA120T00006206001.1